MRKKSRLFTKITTFALAGVLAMGMCSVGNVVKAAEGDVEINEINFPDENFREFVKDQYDTDKNGSLSEPERAIGRMECPDKSIESLKGIEYFAYLNYLDCSKNKLTKLDVSNNRNLQTVLCNNNIIERLDFSDNEALNRLECKKNSLSHINISQNLELKYLDCSTNNLTELDIQNNKLLKKLHCGENQLTSLNVEHCSDLSELLCSENSLTVLDVSKNTKLTDLRCSLNNLTEIDVSSNPELTVLFITYNKLTSIDVSKNSKLYTFQCDHCGLTSLDVSNNPELYKLKCNSNKLKSLNLKNNKKLQVLYCSNNNLTELDLSENKWLYYLSCSKNEITVLNINGIELSTFVYDEDKVHLIKNSVDTITLNKNQLSLVKDKNYQLTTAIAPTDADITTVKWTSSNPSVATVDANGLVTAKAVGNATVTAAAADMSGVTASCAITVTANDATGENTGSTGGDSGSAGGNTGLIGGETGTTDTKTYPAVNVSYRTHIQTFGWEGKAEDIKTWKSNGTMSGTEGKAKRLEGINIVVDSADSNEDLNLGIQYTTHCQSYGWLPWSANGEMNGTEGEAKRLEAIMIQLTGADAKAYDVYYRVHAQSYGWLGWASNGAPAGTAGYGKRLEGIQIVVVKKGEDFDRTMEDIESKESKAFIAKEGSSPIVNHQPTSNTTPVVPGAQEVNVAYRTHVQSFGWQGWKYNGQMSGTSGKAKRLEGINIELRNKDCSGDIVYTTHVQTYGWQGSETDQTKWFKNGAMAGTSGEAKRLEAICIDLTGDMAAKYDIYYRVHAQSYGWLGWASNGAPAGTAGFGKRLEGIQIVLVPKGGAAPTNHEGIKSVEERAYVKK